MLNEPLSWIYATWIFTAWLGIVITARLRGDTDIEADYTAFCLQYLALCELQSARATSSAPYSGTNRGLLPCLVSVLCGARSWGHDNTADLGFAMVLQAAKSARPPREYQTAWVSRALNNPGVLSRLVALYGMLDKTKLWQTHIKFPMKEDFQFIGYEDGSRICIMGSDESAEENENPNANTPSINFFGVLGGVITQAPGFPNPTGGGTRIRSRMVRTDIDGSPSEGWEVQSSEIGFRRGGRFITEIPAYTGSRLKFWYALYSNGMKEQVFPEIAPPTHQDPPPAPRKGGKGCSLILVALGALGASLALCAGILFGVL
jgi:hypothetical protein